MTGLTACSPSATPVLGRSVDIRSISLSPLIPSTYAANSACTSAEAAAASSAARSLSAATTKKVAP